VHVLEHRDPPDRLLWRRAAEFYVDAEEGTVHMTRIGKNACRIGVRDLEKGVRHLVRDGDEISLMPTKEPMYTLHIQGYAMPWRVCGGPLGAKHTLWLAGERLPRPRSTSPTSSRLLRATHRRIHSH
jgi:hypothetical protein